jgi:hypothetical protein
MGAKKKTTCDLVTLGLRLETLETYSKEESETGYTEINPLHLLQPFGHITNILEEYIRRQQWSSHRAYALNGLC